MIHSAGCHRERRYPARRGPRRGNALRWAAVLLLLTMALSACRATPDELPGATNLRIADVTFEGVSSVAVYDLEETLATRKNRINPFESTRYLNQFSISTDLQRIEAFYHRRGYFEARVVDYRIDIDEERRRARVHFVIEEGPPTIVQRIHVDTRRLRQVDAVSLQANLGLRPQQVFSEITAERARLELRRRLMENSYAYARVDLRVYVDRERRTAEIFYFIDQGPASLFGEIEIVGNRLVPDQTIIDRVRVRQGNTYRHSHLRLSQLQLYDMNAFSFVSVESAATRDEERLPLVHRGPRPDGAWAHRSDAFRDAVEDADREARSRGLALLEEHVDTPPKDVQLAQSGLGIFGDVDAVDPNVPIRISVSELPRANYRAGGGFGLESGRTDVYGRASAVWRNAFAPLNRIELDTRAGYAWLPNVFSTDTEGLVFSVQGRYSRPGAIFRIFDFSTRLRYEEDIEIGYRYASPQARVALSRRLTRTMTLSFGYNVDLLFIRNDALAGTDAQEQLLPSEVFLAYLDATLQIDHRDDVLQATRGWFAELEVQLGDPYALGDYAFLRIQPEFRYFLPIGRRIVLGSRVRAGTIFNLGSDPVPRTQRFFLGGGDTVRGFSRRQISPYAFILPDGSSTDNALCLVAADRNDRCRQIPIGGFTSWVFNFEPRYEIGRDWLWGVLFFDAGSVADQDFTWRFNPGGDGLHMGTGFGLRVGTPVGPLRFDFGWRLTDAPEFAGSSRFGFYLSLGEAF